MFSSKEGVVCIRSLGGGQIREKARGERERVYRYEGRMTCSCKKGGKEREVVGNAQ